MPELPETETIARDLNARIVGTRITGVTVLREDVLRGADAATLEALTLGREVARVWRRAKLIVLDLLPATTCERGARSAHEHHSTEDLVHIVVQPRFTGALLVDDGTLPADLADYLTVSFTLHDGRTLHYRDVRRLGTVAVMSNAGFLASSAALGPEPLDASFTAQALCDALGDSSRAIKAALMDQSRLAGVGNIYATESLWEAGIDPSRAVRSLTASQWSALHSALQRILHASVALRGTSFRDYRDASGGRGGFVSELQAYGREGQPCAQCGRRLIATHAIDGRNTVFCATCQR